LSSGDRRPFRPKNVNLGRLWYAIAIRRAIVLPDNRDSQGRLVLTVMPELLDHKAPTGCRELRIRFQLMAPETAEYAPGAPPVLQANPADREHRAKMVKRDRLAMTDILETPVLLDLQDPQVQLDHQVVSDRWVTQEKMAALAPKANRGHLAHLDRLDHPVRQDHLESPATLERKVHPVLLAALETTAHLAVLETLEIQAHLVHLEKMANIVRVPREPRPKFTDFTLQLFIPNLENGLKNSYNWVNF